MTEVIFVIDDASRLSPIFILTQRLFNLLEASHQKSINQAMALQCHTPLPPLHRHILLLLLHHHHRQLLTLSSKKNNLRCPNQGRVH
jgi:hypothetical protein